MARRTKPLTDRELRDRGVPEDVIRYRNGQRRVWTGPLIGVLVEGPSTEVIPPSAEVSREEMGRKIAEARRRFRPRED